MHQPRTPDRATVRPVPLAALAVLLASASACGGGSAPTSASGAIGSAGGTVALSGGPTLVVPAGALAATTQITIRATGQTAPTGAPIYALEPSGTTFASPVTITLPLPKGLAGPAVFWSKPGSSTEYDVVAATVTAAGDAVEAQGTHFGTVFVGPSSGGTVCTDAGAGTYGAACGAGQVCAAGSCVTAYQISGAVTGAAPAGVTVALTGPVSGTATTGAAGTYAFGGLPPGSYTVAPSLAAHGFTPSSAAVNVTTADAGNVDFTDWQPAIASVSPAEGHVGATVTLTGTSFGNSPGTVTLGGLPMPVLSWSNVQITATVPAGAGSVPGLIQVQVGTGVSATQPFTVTAAIAGQIVDGGNAGAWLLDSSGSPARLMVTAAGSGRSTVATPVSGAPYGGFPVAFSLDVPVGGTYTLLIDDLDGGGNPSVDLLQAATRAPPTTYTVSEAGVAGLSIPVRWHWEEHDLATGYNVCNAEAQLRFTDATTGYASFKIGGGVDPTNSAVHGVVMKTTDGGVSWTVASSNIIAPPPVDNYYTTIPGNFENGYLVASGTDVLSLGDGGDTAWSTDGGTTWTTTANGLGAQTIGPGAIGATRVAQAGSTLWVSTESGGVQGSKARADLMKSTDGGHTWNLVWDVCASGGATTCAQNGLVPTDFAGVDLACSDVNPLHCVAMGYDGDAQTSSVLVTQDGFSSYNFKTISPSCGAFTQGRITWIPGTDTAWVVAQPSCPGTPIQYIQTTDGGTTWSPWATAPSPYNNQVRFVDATHGIAWWDWGVLRTTDGATWLFTGHAPVPANPGGSLRTVELVDANDMWVLGSPNCQNSSNAAVARWVP